MLERFDVFTDAARAQQVKSGHSSRAGWVYNPPGQTTMAGGVW
jgi:hypothetical protein